MRRNQWKFVGKNQAKSKALEKLVEAEEEEFPPPFDSPKIYYTIEDIVEKNIDKLAHEGFKAFDNVIACQKLSEEILYNLKSWQDLKKFRIIAVVSIVEKQYQGIQSKLAHSFNQKKEGIVKYHFEDGKMIVLVYVALVNKNNNQ